MDNNTNNGFITDNVDEFSASEALEGDTASISNDALNNSEEITEEEPNETDAQTSLDEALKKAEEERLESLNRFSLFKAFEHTSNARGGNSTPSISIVFTHKNGQRLSVSNTLYEQLEKPKELAVAYNDNELALGSELPVEVPRYPFSPDIYSHTIYRSGMVKGIVKQFELDFSERSSITFSSVRMDSFTNASGVVVPIAIVTMK